LYILRFTKTKLSITKQMNIPKNCWIVNHKKNAQFCMKFDHNFFFKHHLVCTSSKCWIFNINKNAPFCTNLDHQKKDFKYCLVSTPHVKSLVWGLSDLHQNVLFQKGSLYSTRKIYINKKNSVISDLHQNVLFEKHSLHI